MAEGSGSDYALIALMAVPTEKVEQYDQLVAAAGTDVFTKYGWKLMLSGMDTALYNSIGPPPGIQRRLLNVWSIPNFDSLQHVMAQAADNADYVRAQVMTIDELQNLYVKLIWDSPIGLPETPVNYYFAEVLHVVNSSEARINLTNYMNTAVYEMNTAYGWKILFAGNQSTGLINEYVNIWGIADTSRLDEAAAKYRSNPAWRAAVIRVMSALWTPRVLPAFGTPVSST